METNRRQFVMLTVLSATTPASVADAQGGPAQAARTSVSSAEHVVDAGAFADFATEKVYDQFREQGFFVIHRDAKLYALSSICTHKGCKVRLQPDEAFICRCHKSAFDREGRVLNGPAVKDLPRLAVKRGPDDHLLVSLDRQINPNRA
jgi:Rieske Fe-S protein